MNKPIEILLVEDSLADAMLTRKMFQQLNTPNNLYIVEDGVEAIAFLNQEGKYKKSPVPDLILLDLNLPRKNGKEVLAEIKSDERFKNIPVIILSTSEDERDILKCYENYANCYLTKPVNIKDFKKSIRIIEEFWLNLVHFPHK